MTETSAVNAAEEPSIEEILASIRKIISDEPAAEGEAAAPPAPEPVPQALPEEPEEDILDLSAFQSTSSPLPMAEPVASEPPTMDLDLADNGKDAAMDMADIMPKHLEIAASQNNFVPQMPPPVADSGIASPHTLDVAAAALARLRPPEPAAPPAGPTQLWVGTRTIEQVVEDLLRPILKTWLDENLPRLVENLVEKELARMSRRAGE